MKRSVYVVGILTSVVVPFLAVTVGCEDDTGASCVKDTDCPPSNICRNNVCGTVNPDGGFLDDAAAIDTDSGGSCTGDGIICTLSSECCSGNCDESHCASFGAPTCKVSNELCALDTDCCDGLTCKTIAGASSCQ